MPWHDVAVCVYGPSASDLAWHFIEYWNHAKIDYEGTKNKRGGILKPTGGSFYSKELPFDIPDHNESRQLVRIPEEPEYENEETKDEEPRW